MRGISDTSTCIHGLFSEIVSISIRGVSSDEGGRI